jgi:spore coat protein U-like protein
VTCTNSTAYEVGLNDGLHFSANRRMKTLLLPNYVSYELYRDASRSLRWGNTVSVDTLSGTGTGASQPLTVYGRVPSQTSQPVGVYNDTITVTVTY